MSIAIFYNAFITSHEIGNSEMPIIIFIIAIDKCD